MMPTQRIRRRRVGAGALLLCTGLAGSAMAQLVMPDPHRHAPSTAAAAPEVRSVRTPGGWMLERVEPVAPAGTTARAASPVRDEERKANVRVVVTPAGLSMLEHVDAAPLPADAPVDTKRHVVRTLGNGQKVLELKGMAVDAVAPAPAARTAAPAPAGFKVVELRRQGGVLALPAEPEPKVLYRVID
jgi:hypothetical protein